MHMAHDSLTKQLDAFRGGFIARLPLNERQMILDAAEDLRAGQTGREYPHAGDMAPEIALINQCNKPVSLSERLKFGPVVVLFVRGAWCPFCTLTLRAYQDAYPAIRAAGADLIAVTPQPGGSCSAMVERDLLSFSVLSDLGNQVADQYGVAYELAPALRRIYARLGHDLPKLNQTGDWRVPLPATFIIGSDGRVVKAHVEPTAHRRLEPEQVLTVLDRLRVDA